MQNAAQDRRLKGRYELHLPMHYHVSLKGEAAKAGSGTTCDMSASGLSFRCRRSLPVGAHVEILIEWPAMYRAVPLSLQATGFIVRCDGSRIAVRMTSHKFKVMPLEPARATA